MGLLADPSACIFTIIRASLRQALFTLNPCPLFPLEEELEAAERAVCFSLDGFSSAYEAHFTSLEENWCFSTTDANVIFPVCFSYHSCLLKSHVSVSLKLILDVQKVNSLVILLVMVGEHTIDMYLPYHLEFSGLGLPILNT